MSLEDFNTAVKIIENHNEGDFLGPIDDEIISKAEKALGLVFPVEYRAFLLKFGVGNVGSTEFFGIINDKFDNASVPNGIWYTLHERKSMNLPKNLIIIGDSGMGELYCIRIVAEGVCPIVVYIPGIPNEDQSYEILSDDFGSYFLKKVQQQI